MRIVFRGPWAAEQISTLGNIKEENGREILIEVDAVKAAEVASTLFAKFPVQDLSITTTPLERIVESIYLENSPILPEKV